MYIGVLSSVGCKCLKCLFCTVSGGAGGKLQPTVLSDLVSPEGFVRINSSITPFQTVICARHKPPFSNHCSFAHTLMSYQTSCKDVCCPMHVDDAIVYVLS